LQAFFSATWAFDASTLQAVPPLRSDFLRTCAVISSLAYGIRSSAGIPISMRLIFTAGNLPSLDCNLSPSVHAGRKQQAGNICRFVLSLLMYGSVHAVLQSYPDKIRFGMFGRDDAKNVEFSAFMVFSVNSIDCE
jgi:hypothetical protein